MPPPCAEIIGPVRSPVFLSMPLSDLTVSVSVMSSSGKAGATSTAATSGTAACAVGAVLSGGAGASSSVMWVGTTACSVGGTLSGGAGAPSSMVWAGTVAPAAVSAVASAVARMPGEMVLGGGWPEPHTPSTVCGGPWGSFSGAHTPEEGAYRREEKETL